MLTLMVHLCNFSMPVALIHMQDLVLIHWPGTARQPLNSYVHSQLRLQTWRVLEDYYLHGR